MTKFSKGYLIGRVLAGSATKRLTYGPANDLRQVNEASLRSVDLHDEPMSPENFFHSHINYKDSKFKGQVDERRLQTICSKISLMSILFHICEQGEYKFWKCLETILIYEVNNVSVLFFLLDFYKINDKENVFLKLDIINEFGEAFTRNGGSINGIEDFFDKYGKLDQPSKVLDNTPYEWYEHMQNCFLYSFYHMGDRYLDSYFNTDIFKFNDEINIRCMAIGDIKYLISKHKDKLADKTFVDEENDFIVVVLTDLDIFYKQKEEIVQCIQEAGLEFEDRT